MTKQAGLNNTVTELKHQLSALDTQIADYIKLGEDDNIKWKALAKDAIAIKKRLFMMTGSASGEVPEVKLASLVVELQQQLRDTESEFDNFRGANIHRWQGEEWQIVSKRAAMIRMQLFELTGDHYGKPKVKKVRPSDELLYAEYETPSDVPREVRDWLRSSSLLFSDATDAVRWSRIINTLNDERYPDEDLTIYRALENGDEIRPGDWITTNLEYAEQHLARSLNGNGHILDETVNGLDVLVSPTGDFDEAIYAPREFSGALESRAAMNPTALTRAWFDLRFEKEVPNLLRTVAETICETYQISGVSDPMYICNVVAPELGLGDGNGQFTQQTPDITEDALLKVANRLCFAYATKTGNETPENMFRLISQTLGLAEECEERFAMG
jgi:hypothetical protein